MEVLQTPVSISPSIQKMALKHRIFTTGSCFSDVIGKRLSMCKIHTTVNPFGVSYNPVSIHNLLRSTINAESIPAEGFLTRDGAWYHYDFHSSLAALTQHDLQHGLDGKIRNAHAQLLASDWIIITYGSAWVYELADSLRIVSNCHKMPGNLFRKRLLSVEEMTTSFGLLYDQLKKKNPTARMILTLSPVRHTKDTLALNNVSKSLLRVVTHQWSAEYKDVSYFPSFEIMIDELRDYRFYKRDMIHPTEQAEDFIWNKFIECYFDQEAKNFVIEWKRMEAALSHRPFNIHSDGHQNFIKQTISKLEQLQSLVDVSAELAALRSQLNP